MHAVRIGVIFVLLLTVSYFVRNTYLKQDSVRAIPKNLQKYIMYDQLPANTEEEVIGLNSKIFEINTKRQISNWKEFGPPGRETVTIVVQVHKDIKRLQYLIISLARVRYIDSVLLVFSHSYYSEHMNRLIESIDFCKVMQIFYPHSVQLYPNNFPGIDLEDCIEGSQSTSKPRHCQQRDARSAERKHHWWWKANFIFERMQWSSSYAGSVIFLEEDQYVAPDLLHMLQYLQRSLTYFPDVEIMSLGTMYAQNLDPHLLTLEHWRPPFDVGIVFNKTTWEKIVELSSFYCMYDDSSWTYSLLNVFKNFPKGDVDMVACVTPRIISMKQFNHEEEQEELALELSGLFSKLKLFPEKVNTVHLFESNGNKVYLDVQAPPRGNGGWADIKDHLLCIDPLTPLIPENYESTVASRYDLYTA